MGTDEMADVETANPPAMAPQDPAVEETSTALTTTNSDVAMTGERKMKKIIRKKKRPARPQVDPSTMKSEPPPQTGTIFNIWYNKWSGGDREDKYLSKTAAAGRCNIAKDTGYTRAALKGAQAVAPKPKISAPSGPLVAYDSDSD